MILPDIHPIVMVPAFVHRAGVAFEPEGGRGADVRPRPARVLVVEDDYFVAMEIEATLLDLGCDVIAMPATAEEALVIAEREPPDLILMDIRLAGHMDGIEAATRIYDGLGIRSLFVTAHSDPGTFERGEVANPRGWVSKPFTSGQLAASVEAALRAIDLGK